MICQKCFKEFEEKDISVSHDIPKYLGGHDIDGRHNLCKKCHDIYERLICWKMTSILSNEIKIEMKSVGLNFAKSYFKKNDTKKTTN